MKTKIDYRSHWLLAVTAAFWVYAEAAIADSAPIATIGSDNVTIYGEPYFGSLDDSAPLILLFHQSGSNGRAEYATIAAWLNDNGFRAIAWDQRSGGDLHGGSNRTATQLADNVATGYCDAYADLDAALRYVRDEGLADKVVLWGSSYSAALVFRLAAEKQDAVAGLIAFSPASGGPMVDCRARLWVENVHSPKLVLRPDSEMARKSSVEQQQILSRAGARFITVENGVHGSSMLLDERTDHDMAEVRGTVIDWLRNTTEM